MKKEIVKYIFKMLFALVILISFGLAGEWDYQDYASRQETIVKY